MDKSPAEALSGNVRWLLETTTLDSQAKIAKAAKVDQKTVGRMLNMGNSPTLASIVAVAAVIKIDAWQLLAPNFGEGYYGVDATCTPPQIVPVRRPTVTTSGKRADAGARRATSTR